MFAEVKFNLSNKKFLNTILIRLNDDYYVYDDYMKRYINMTSNSYSEDLTTRPFGRVYDNYK